MSFTTFAAALHKGCLALEDGESFLEAVDLGLAACLALFVGLGLGNAPLLDLAVVFHDCRELCVGGVAVPREFSDFLVQGRRLLPLVLCILLFCSLGHLVLL